MRLGALLIGLNSGLVLLAVLVLAVAGVRLLASLADQEALAQVTRTAIAAREAIERSGRDVATSARLLGERPTISRLLLAGNRAGLEAFLDRFRGTSRLSSAILRFPGREEIRNGDGALSWRDASSAGDGWTLLAPSHGGPALVATAPIVTAPFGTALVAARLDGPLLAGISHQVGAEVKLGFDDLPGGAEAEAATDSRSDELASLRARARAAGRVMAERSESRQAYVALVPLRSSGGEGGAWIEVHLPRLPVAVSLYRLVRQLVVVAIGVVVAASLTGLLIGARIAGPVRELTATAARLGRGDLTTPVLKIEGTERVAISEISELASTLETTRRQLSRLTSELRRRQAEGEAILTGVAEGVFSVDRDRRINYLNPQAAALLGIRAEHAIGRFCGDVLRPLGSDGLRPCDEHCPIVHARFRGATRASERLQLDSGEQRTVVLISSPPAEERQIVVLSDETEQDAARRLRDAVLANISHEFRTPLAAQRASLELLREHLLADREDTDPAARDLVAALERGGLRLTQLIDNLLESVRIESGSSSLRRAPVALDEVVEEAAEVTHPLLAQRGQRLEIELPWPLPEIEGDGPRLAQVFVNLLANANKFAPPESVVRIGARVDEHEIRLWIEDQGPGFPEGDGAATTLFERFVRAPALQAEPEAAGMGLGLWIVQSIVEGHGGRVETERSSSTSRVVVVLPRGPAQAEDRA